MEHYIKQWYTIKFCVKLKKSATKTFENLTDTYGDATNLSRNVVSTLHKAFKAGQENVEDKPCSWRSVSSADDHSVEVMWDVMMKDCWLGIRMTSEETDLDKNAFHRILTNVLHMWKMCTKLVPKDLSVAEKKNQLEIYQDLLWRLIIKPNFLEEVITGDESWVSKYDPKTKWQSEE